MKNYSDFKVDTASDNAFALTIKSGGALETDFVPVFPVTEESKDFVSTIVAEKVEENGMVYNTISVSKGDYLTNSHFGVGVIKQNEANEYFDVVDYKSFNNNEFKNRAELIYSNDNIDNMVATSHGRAEKVMEKYESEHFEQIASKMPEDMKDFMMDEIAKSKGLLDYHQQQGMDFNQNDITIANARIMTNMISSPSELSEIVQGFKQKENSNISLRR